MKTIKQNLFLFSILFAFVISSCSTPGADNGNGLDSKTYSGAGVISSKGGTVTAGTKLALNIPSDALLQETKITANYSTDPEKIGTPNKVADLLAYAEFGPSGTQFEKPVNVSIELSEAPDTSEVSIFCYNESDDEWNFVSTASVNGTKANFEISHFSRYVAVKVTPDMLFYFDELVKLYAPEDELIKSKYKDYLINTCHLMKKNTIYRNFYYKPIQLFFSGDYCKNDNGNITENTIVDAYDENFYDPTKTLHADYASSTRKLDYQKKKQGVKESTSESSYISRCLVDIQYDMIKPDISISASDTELDIGESCTLTIWCTDPDSDLDFNNYPLSVMTNDRDIISISTSNVTTDDNGRATLTVKRTGKGDGTITVTFAQKDCDGQYVSSSNEITFEYEESQYKFNLTIDYKKNNHSEPNPLFIPGELTDFSYPDHSFACEYSIDGSFSIIPFSDEIRNSEGFSESGLSGFVVGTATFKGNKDKTKYSYGDHSLSYLINTGFEKKPRDISTKWDVSINYNDITTPLLGVSYTDGHVILFAAEGLDTNAYKKVHTPDECIDYCLNYLFPDDDILMNTLAKYTDKATGIISEKVITTETTVYDGDSDKETDTQYLNIIPFAYISSKINTNITSIPVDSDNIYSYPDSYIDIAEVDMCAGPSDSDDEKYNATIQFTRK